MDNYYGVMLYWYATDKWFCMTLDIVSHIYLIYVLIRSILDIDSSDVDAIGLILDDSIEISEEIFEAFEQATQVKRRLVSLKDVMIIQNYQVKIMKMKN